MKTIFQYSAIIICLFSILLFTGCKKELGTISGNAGDVKNSVYQQMKLQTHTTAYIKSRKLAGQPYGMGYSASGVWYDDGLQNLIDGGQMQIDDKRFKFGGVNRYEPSDGVWTKAEKSNWIPGKFGKDIKFEFEGSKHNVTIDLYLPDDIFLNNVSRDKSNTIARNQGHSVSWNADPANKNGVEITVDFEGTIISPDGMRYSTGEKTSKTLLVNDNGSYVIPGDFFSLFPENAMLKISVRRGNLKLFKDEVTDRTFKAYGYSRDRHYSILR